MELQPGGLELMGLGFDKVIGADGADDITDADFDAAVVVAKSLSGWEVHVIGAVCSGEMGPALAFDNPVDGVFVNAEFLGDGGVGDVGFRELLEP